MHRIALSVAFVLGAGAAIADDVLFDFGKGFDPAAVKAQDAKVSGPGAGGAGGLRVATFHAERWPGIALAAPGGKWDLSRRAELAVDVRNAGAKEVTVHCRLDNPGADGSKNCLNGSARLNPGESGTIRIPLVRKAPGDLRLFGMRGYPEGWDPKATFDPANAIQILLFVNQPKEDHIFEVQRVRACGAPVPAPEGGAGGFFPCIDTFGQYIHRDWPGKVHSIEELSRRRADEEKDIAARPGPEDWDRFGGWKSGPALQATGHFRVEKHRGKWWLVDPEGKLFFSHGIDCVRMLDVTPIDERGAWFQDFPGEKPEFQEFIVPSAFALHGHYAGKRPRCFGFAGANLKRKYGAEWRQASAEIAHRRLRSWGLNTIGNWSEASVSRMGKTPYTATLHTGGRMIEGSQGYWGKFPDVFDPGFEAEARRRFAERAAGTAEDPFCIGYFVDNEMSWGDEVSLAVGALRSPPDQAAKKAFLEDLKRKHGSVGKLNEAWGTAHASWEALLESREAPDPKKAREDLATFYSRTAEQYFRTVRDALRQAAPKKLYLGCRFAWGNEAAARAAAQFCDVVSYNFYRRSVADFKFPGGADVPLIIGEYHFGALDRGMFHTGLVPVKDQAERARAYREYVQGALRHPAFVGCHWFQWQDEPTTGRVYDEENYQIGFVDIADTPYPETIEASREVGHGMYRLRLGE